MFRDSHIEDVLLGKISNHSNHVYIKASVKPEQRQTAQRYQTWVLLSVNCGIKSAGCGCVAADDGSCKHAVAVLFALADYFARNTDKGTAVGTDEPCTWTKPRKASLPVKVEDLDYRAERKTPRKPGPLPKHYKPLSNVTNSCILNIQEHVKKVCEDFHPGALYLKPVQEPPPPVEARVPSISDLHAKYQASSTDNVSFIDYLRQKTSKQQRDILRNSDQSDPAWLAARKGRITASLADSIRSVRDVHNCRTLVDKIMGTSKPFQSSSTEFGKENEHVGRQLYVVHVDKMKSHKNFKVNTCGLVLDDNMPFMGASPDGIVSCTCHGEKLLEIKCSFKHRNIHVEDIPTKDPAYHLKAVNGQLQLKKSSSWYSQIQFQLGVTHMNVCDLVVYTLKGIKAIPVKFDPEAWEVLKKKAELVFLNAVMCNEE